MANTAKTNDDAGPTGVGPGQQSVSSGSFAGVPFPPDVLAHVWVTILTGSPFSNAITPLPTARGSVAFPTAAPSGAAWVSEGQPLPPVTMGDSALISTPRKLAALLALSNESINDGVIPVGDLAGQAIRDAMSAQMDDGLLHGSGTAPNPDGILGHATAATSKPDFRAAVIEAWGEVVKAGAPADQVMAFANPAVLATEWARVGTTGDPIHEDSPTGVLTIGPGIQTVPVPALAGGTTPEILVADVSSVYMVIRDPLMIEMSREIYFSSDQLGLRVKCRVACACPTPAKSLRTAIIA
jgi:HK97 family phage major capsid protein